MCVRVCAIGVTFHVVGLENSCSEKQVKENHRFLPQFFWKRPKQDTDVKESIILKG